jgi:hypothetical protein
VPPYKWARFLLRKPLVTRECHQIILDILDRRLHILAGAHAPYNHAIGEDSIIQLTQVEGWNLNGTSIHLEIYMQLFQWGARVMMHT